MNSERHERPKRKCFAGLFSKTDRSSKIKSYRTAFHQKRISRPTDLELLVKKKLFPNLRLASMCFHNVSMNGASRVRGKQSPHKVDSQYLAQSLTPTPVSFLYHD